MNFDLQRFAEFETAKTCSVKMKIGLNAGGKIAQNTDTVKTTKAFTLNGIKPDATLANADTVFSAIIAIAGASYHDKYSAVKITEQEVDD